MNKSKFDTNNLENEFLNYWDINQISPGTEFMMKISDFIKDYITE